MVVANENTHGHYGYLTTPFADQARERRCRGPRVSPTHERALGNDAQHMHFCSLARSFLQLGYGVVNLASDRAEQLRIWIGRIGAAEPENQERV